MAESTSLVNLERKLGADWSHLREARAQSAKKRDEVRAAVEGLDSEDTSIVVSGSLARDEFTPGSDIDWMLLIDGQADPRHHNLSRRIDEIFQDLAKSPRRDGPFAGMVFSHNLIHEIGGKDDTNLNLTRRSSLLLESEAVGRTEAYNQVLRGILTRYLLEDRGLWQTGARDRIPRFLQNDFARYWRTMAVDFAYKLRERSSEGWAIRNIKLRMSRKLIYVAGLLSCYFCHLTLGEDQKNAAFGVPEFQRGLIEILDVVLRSTPLEILAYRLSTYDHLQETARKLFGAYNGFVGILADVEKRKRLEGLKESEADDDPVYQEARNLSHDFRDGLSEFFFDEESGMNELTKIYGVF